MDATEDQAKRWNSTAGRAWVESQELLDRVFKPIEALLVDAVTSAARFDAICSRFGVMFFSDPVAAFANLRRAARDDGRLRFIAWRGPADNPFMTTAERAARPLLDLPERKPDAPGQFAFASDRRVHAILEGSGWIDIEIRPSDVACAMRASDLVAYVSRLGPVGTALQEADEATRTRVLEVVRPAFDSYVHEGEVRFAAACWMVTAVCRRH